MKNWKRKRRRYCKGSGINGGGKEREKRPVGRVARSVGVIKSVIFKGMGITGGD
jgi:hypothetical protein